jgi:hypothetical protein
VIRVVAADEGEGTGPGQAAAAAAAQQALPASEAVSRAELELAFRKVLYYASRWAIGAGGQGLLPKGAGLGQRAVEQRAVEPSS